MSDLNNQTVFITGASRGIGAATAHEFARQGANVVLAARSTSDIEKHAATIQADGGKALAVACDVADNTQVELAVKAAENAFGYVTVLVNNAGIIDPIGRMDDLDPADWGKVIDINVKGVYHCARAVLPGMQAAGGGTIVNISSGAATNAMEGWSHYCSSKAAVLMVTRCLHKEFADKGVRAVGLSPGTVATQMQVDIKASGINPVSQLDPNVHIPPEWPAKAIAWLCTAEADPHLGGDVSLRDEAIRQAVGLI
jgi:NAD(P)-dependent dehydrogenase (short-subunit alcohol dehydrogenase family)